MKVDLLILNNCPAFYKINLYNKLAEHRNIFVIFSGLSDQVIPAEKRNFRFNYIILNNFQVERRSRLRDFIRIFQLYRKLQPTKIVYGGYVMLEYLMLAFMVASKRNILQTESGSETSLTGTKFYLKKIIMSRFSIALVSGSIHKEMLLKMGFSGRVKITKGVGIIDKKDLKYERKVNASPKFLYVGRLIPQKNLERLIDVFNKNGHKLLIIGKGYLEDDLKKTASSNVEFLGEIANNLLEKYYKSYDIFILPSLSEPWGLVVEEALYYGCVLALSGNVGSAPEMLTQVGTGVLFDPVDTLSMENAIRDVVDNLENYRAKVENYDLAKKDAYQLQQYIFL